MKILFTGASSFTGMHFVQALLKAGHEVHCTFSRENNFAYSPEEQVRISTFTQHTHNRWNSPFGGGWFWRELEDDIDVVCLHGAKGLSGGGPNIDFDVIGAVESNTFNVPGVMRNIKKAGVKKVVLTGTYFERWNGLLHNGNNTNPPKNAYALSKTLTSDIIKFYCDESGIPFTKFIIPNPFGPYENKRFTTDAAMAWLDGKHFTVLDPDPNRDNIHVSLLAECYAKFVSDNVRMELAPRGYQTSQGDFALKFAREMRSRLGVPCPLDFAQSQKTASGFSDYRGNRTYPEEYLKPDHTGNDGLPAPIPLSQIWDEGIAWAELAEYYKRIHKATRFK